MVKLVNYDRARLFCISNESTVSICNVLTQPPTLECILRGHTQPVTGKMFILNENSLNVIGKTCF